MKKSLTDYFTVLMGTGLGRGLAFLNSLIIARVLGKEDFGRFTIFFVVMVLTWIFPQAFDTVFVRYASTASNEKEKTEYLRISFFFKLVYSGLALALAYPLSFLLANVFFEKPEINILIVFAIVSGVFQAFLMTIASIFQAKQKFNFFSVLYVSFTFSVFIGLVILWLGPVPFSLANVIFIYVLISVLIGAFSIILLLNRKIKYILPLNKEFVKKTFALGKWVFGSVVIVFLFARLDTFILPRYISFQKLGIYGIAQQVTMLVSVLSGALSNVFLPKACGSIRESGAFKRYLYESSIIVLAILFFLCLLMFFTGRVIAVLYGQEYLEAQNIVRVLLLGWIFRIIFIPFGALFYAFDDSKLKFYVDLFCFFCAIISLFLLVPSFKELGAAWGMTFAQFLGFFAGFYCLFYSIKKNARKLV